MLTDGWLCSFVCDYLLIQAVPSSVPNFLEIAIDGLHALALTGRGLGVDFNGSLQVQTRCKERILYETPPAQW